MKNDCRSLGHEESGARAESAPAGTRYGDLVGVSAPMKRLFEKLQRLESSLSTVLVQGETGTGKELVARAIHDHSVLHEGPFIAVNCGALHRDLAQSELFGHVRGAFTGAAQARAGAFVSADTGSLFLDEIGELPLELQPILLRALEERKITPVGDHRERPVNVRVIAATHQNLAHAVESGTFRADLFYRLRVVRVGIPPLRERPEDIEFLIRYFIERAHSAPPPESISKAWRERPWHGNVRELRNEIDAYLATGEPSPASQPHDAVRTLRPYVDIDRPYQQLRSELLAEFTLAYVGELLSQTDGNVTEASRRSGMERSYLNKLVKRFGLRARPSRVRTPHVDGGSGTHLSVTDSHCDRGACVKRCG